MRRWSTFSKIIVAATALLIGACASSYHLSPDARYVRTTISGVLRAPDQFDQKNVELVGILMLGFEQKNLYESASAAKDKEYKRCLGLDFLQQTALTDRAAALNHKMVRVRGLVRGNICGKTNVCLNWCNIPGIEVHDLAAAY